MEQAKEIVVENKQKRETGFEILRIVSMFLITCVHVLNYGGMLNNAGGTLSSQLSMKLIYTLFTTAVNIFVLITGYFMINSKFKLKKLFTLWVQVFAYSFVSYIIAVAVFDRSFDLKDCIYSFIPIINQKFWFISAYFLLNLISPFLNNMIKNSSQKQLKYLMIGILIFIYITSRFDIKGVASLAKGYSFIWFIILYITGAYFSLNPPVWNKLRILSIYILCIFATWAMFAYPQDGKLSFLYMCDTNYNSPLVFVASICIFLMFRDFYIKNATVHRIICFFSSCMFGIYLFQESYIKHNIYFDIIKVSKYYSSSVPAWLNVLYLALLIFVFGLVVEMVRKGVVKLLNKIYKKLKSLR